MELPNAHRALVDPAKVRDYLLSATHPVGRFKAAFFATLGFEPEDWEHLRDALLDLARSGEASEGKPSPYGEKYEVRATIQGPNGAAEIVSVWMVFTGENVPRFITAFPT